MVRVYNEDEKGELDGACGPLRLTKLGTAVKEVQEAINTNEKISLAYNNATGILQILVDGVEKAWINLGLEKYVNQAEIVIDPPGQASGKYIKLQFEGGAPDVFIPTEDIGKIYTAGTNIEITSTGVINNTMDISGKINTSEKGQANGVATLDSGAKVPNSQLPSLNFLEKSVEITGIKYFPNESDALQYSGLNSTVLCIYPEEE